MLKMLNEGFDKKYKDNIVSKKNRKKIVEAVERPEEFAEFDDDMNPLNYGIEEDLFDVLDTTAKGISDNINTITGKDSILRDKNLGKNLTDIGDTVAKIKTGGMFKEDIEANLGVFHNDNGNDYKVIERSKSGHNALLQRGNQWVIAWNCPESNEGSWGQGHYFFDEKTAREVWEEKYINESLNEGIKRIISGLNEAEMSDEDKRDSEILRRIYDKTQQRANAALTAEEKAVLNKYGLARSTWDKNIDVFFGDNNYTKPLVNKNEQPGNPRSRYSRDSNKINYADRARKIKERGAGYARSLPYNPFNGISSDDHREWQDPKTGKWVRLNDKGLLDKERAAQNTTMTDKVVSMRQSLDDRKYHGKKVADNDAEYDAKRAQLEKEYQKRLADLEHTRQFSGKYHQDYLDKANQNIDKLLGRDKKEESLSCKEESCDNMKKAVAEDFDERNLERVGTAEYQANTKRQEHIDMYRKFANLLPDEEITEDNIDEWALTRTACLANREPARIKAEILGQRYSDYELR